MNIILVGLNHKTAPIELREKFSFSSDEIEQALTSLAAHSSLSEAVILSTCNRVEIYAYGVSEDVVKQWLCNRGDQRVVFNDFSQHSYTLQGIEAVEHLMQVACGLDSLVLGEPEIFGQVKSAFSLACLHKAVGPYLSRLFRQTFHIAKKIRTSTKIGACPVSVASTAVMYLSEWWGNVSPSPRILVIGVGDVGRLVVKHAKSLTSSPLFIMSRHVVNAQRVAEEVRGVAVELTQLPEILHKVDVVISATSSKGTIISAECVSQIEKPILMMDLAVPRDISSDVEKNPYVHLCQLDQLKETIQAHVHARSHAAMQAEKLIEEAACEFILSLRALNSDEIVKHYRANMEIYCQQELEKVLHKNSGGSLTHADLKNFSQNLLNKIMHQPSVQLRQASVEGRDEVLKSASEIFGIQGNIKQ